MDVATDFVPRAMCEKSRLRHLRTDASFLRGGSTFCFAIGIMIFRFTSPSIIAGKRPRAAAAIAAANIIGGASPPLRLGQLTEYSV